MELILFLLKKKIEGFYVSIGAFEEFCRSLRVLIERKQSCAVYFASRKTLWRAARDEESTAALNNADIIIPGSRWLARCLRWQYSVKAEKIGRENLVDYLLQNLPWELICIYGDDNAMLKKLSARYPGVAVVRSNVKEPQKVLEEGGYSLVLVCLSEKDQLVWISKMRGKVQACLLGLGDGTERWF